MKNLSFAIRNLFRPGRHNAMKIVCLGMGLAVGSILIAKVYFERSYDSMWADADRIYMISENFKQDGDWREYDQTSGGIAPALKECSPYVELATRLTNIGGDKFTTEDKKKEVQADNIAFADSCFFQMFNLKILAGDGVKALSRPDACAISKSMADRLGGNVLEKKIIDSNLGFRPVTIAAVFEDMPEQSEVWRGDVLFPMSAVGHYMFDGSNGYYGNDRYQSFVKLRKGRGADDMRKSVNKLLHDYLPLDDLKREGIEMDFSLTRITDVHASDNRVHQTTNILLLLAVLMLTASVVNYLLTEISQTVGRSREMAIRKCYGAGQREINSLVSTEALLHWALSIGIAALLLWAGKSIVKDLLDIENLATIFAGRGILIVAAIALLVLVLTAAVPSRLYQRIPVSAAFRNYSLHRRQWKRALLSVEFILVGLLSCMLWVIGRQYSRMVNDNVGYDTQNLAYCYTPTASQEDWQRRIMIKSELQKLPCVTGVTGAYTRPFDNQSGDYIKEPPSDDATHISDMYFVQPDYFDVMGIKIVDGHTFTSEYGDTTHLEIMVEKRLVDQMQQKGLWRDGAIGHSLTCTSFGNNLYTICGVFSNIRTGTIAEKEREPAIFFSSGSFVFPNILIRFKQLSPESMKQAEAVFHKIAPDWQIELKVYQNELRSQYDETRRTSQSVMIASVLTLLIALIGLVGYIVGEVGRRSKEIAIRKVNGAEPPSVYSLFMKDTLWMALPGLTLGAMGAAYMASNFLELFSTRVSLALWGFALIVIGLALIALAATWVCCRKIVRSNPVEYLKNE